MKRLLIWWYQLSLPRHTPNVTPIERERVRYARLTSNFTLLILVASILLLPLSVINTFNSSSSILAFISLGIVLTSVIFSKLGLNVVAASLLVLNTIIQVSGTMLTNPLDPSMIPIFDVLVIPVILSGALMPPAAALVTGGANSAIILLIAAFQPHTAYYAQMSKLGSYSITLIALPVTIQLLVAVITFVIMRSLQATIRRADRAEEIVSLQQEVAQHERAEAKNQQQLAEGISIISQVHTAIANGNLDARVPLHAEHVLWQVAIPLNNLLNRVQHWKEHAEQHERTQTAVAQIVAELQRAQIQHVPVRLPQHTGTPIDPLLIEMNRIAEATRPFQQ